MPMSDQSCPRCWRAAPCTAGPADAGDHSVAASDGRPGASRPCSRSSSPGGALTGQSGQLIVRTSPANLAEIKRALRRSTGPLRRLQISVRFDDSLEAASQGIEAGGRVGGGGSRVDVRAKGAAPRSADRVDQQLVSSRAAAPHHHGTILRPAAGSGSPPVPGELVVRSFAASSSCGIVVLSSATSVIRVAARASSWPSWRRRFPSRPHCAAPAPAPTQDRGPALFVDRKQRRRRGAEPAPFQAGSKASGLSRIHLMSCMTDQSLNRAGERGASSNPNKRLLEPQTGTAVRPPTLSSPRKRVIQYSRAICDQSVRRGVLIPAFAG